MTRAFQQNRNWPAFADAPTHAYYFATPTIFRAQSALFARARLDAFLKVYVEGFLRFGGDAEGATEGCLASSIRHPCLSTSGREACSNTPWPKPQAKRFAPR